VRESASLYFKNFFEFVPVDEISSLPKKIRGLYALYEKDEEGYYNLRYVGMTDGGAKGRLNKHSIAKSGKWSHCSVYEVWDNVTQEQIRELEALFRHTLRLDATASGLNIQRGSAIFRRLKKETLARVARDAV
jgi:hypothetical protein